MQAKYRAAILLEEVTRLPGMTEDIFGEGCLPLPRTPRLSNYEDRRARTLSDVFKVKTSLQASCN